MEWERRIIGNVPVASALQIPHRFVEMVNPSPSRIGGNRRPIYNTAQPRGRIPNLRRNIAHPMVEVDVVSDSLLSSIEPDNSYENPESAKGTGQHEHQTYHSRARILQCQNQISICFVLRSRKTSGWMNVCVGMPN